MPNNSPGEWTQIGVAVRVEGAPTAEWNDGEIEQLLAQLGHPETCEESQIIPFKYRSQTQFMTFSPAQGSWVWKTVAELGPDLEEQRGPWLYISQSTPQTALQYAGTLAKEINDKNHPIKGGVLKLLVMGLTAPPGGATA